MKAYTIKEKMYWAVGFLLFALCLLIPAASAEAATTYYMSPTGIDDPDRNGSSGQPWRTLGYANKRLSPGDTLYIRGGTYNNEYIDDSDWTANGTSAAPITISGYPGETAIFDGNGTTATFLHDLTNSSYITIKDIEVRNYKYYVILLLRNCDNWTFDNIYLHDSGKNLTTDTAFVSGIMVSTSDNTTIKNSRIVNIGTPIGRYPAQTHAIYMGANTANVNIFNNYIENSVGGGIHGWHANNFNGGNIYNNVIANNNMGIVFDDGAQNVNIYNNTLYNNTYANFAFNQTGDDIAGVNNIVLKNNISYSQGNRGILIDAKNQPEVSWDYNLWYDPSGAPIWWGIVGGNTSTGVHYTVAQCKANTTNCDNDVQANPLFVNASGDDFHLQSTSPAINAGTTVSGVTTDKDGVSRPQGAAFDLGAFEAPSSASGVNRALNKTITSNGTLTGTTSVAHATDGVSSNTANYTSYDPKTNGVYVQLDLGASYNIDTVKLWHYYGDTRAYHDVIVQLSNDATFATKTTVFNNDTDNSSLQGAGTDAEYTESSAGKTITFPAVNARYVRLWTNGNTVNGYNNYVEVEVWDTPNLALNKTITSNGTLTGTTSVAHATDGVSSNTANYTSYDPKTNGVYVQLDLGASYDIDTVKLWHYYGDTRAYHDVIVQLSNDATFATKTTVFNNDTDNSSLQGAGTDAEYTESSAGKTITFPAVNARYVRLWTNGNTVNGYNNYVEVEVFE
ncbi:discoidin domain-containing protein [Paenibacillus flagellatus]|nr:discoidin domain-containing protein [Paenibacillus flagellatus]